MHVYADHYNEEYSCLYEGGWVCVVRRLLYEISRKVMFSLKKLIDGHELREVS